MFYHFEHMLVQIEAMEANLEKKDHKVLFKISSRHFGYPVWMLPTFAFVSCVVLSLVYDFDASTSTHCHVPNYLPSISSAIGGYTPQRYIWRICVGLHSWPRLMLAFINYKHYSSFHITHNPGLFTLLLRVSCAMNVVENLALITLSMISSTENYGVHEKAFILFMIGSISYMLITCILFRWAKSPDLMTQQDSKSYKYKIRIFAFNVLSFVAAAYFFYRHNTYCEPGVYTGFAVGEYCIVSSNIAFHTTVLHWDYGSFAYLEPVRTNVNGRTYNDYV